jgi:yecA family protein
MLAAKDKKTLEKLLRLAPEPELAFNYHELCGFLFGLAMTPEWISLDEWLPIIFGGDPPEVKDEKEMAKLTDCLTRIYNQLVTAFHDDTLHFPFDLDTLHNNRLEAVYDWVSGFEEALLLREEVWDPEEYPKMAVRKKEDLMHSLMTIQGLVDPTDLLEMFEKLPDEVFKDTFPGMAGETTDRELQIQVFLLATLPLSIETLQNHARSIEKKRKRKAGGQPIPIPIRPAKTDQNPPCSCPGGGSCCSSPPPPPKKEAKIIKVDFPQHGKKHRPPTAPVFQLKINLQGARPPIWRRIQVPGDTTLARLHKVIQLCMGWTDSHLHQFFIDHSCYSSPDMDDMADSHTAKDEGQFTLQALQNKILPGFQYIYDFGDDWLHQIAIEKVLGPEEGKPYPILLTGKRACPPEDIGGIPGFLFLLEVLKNPEDEAYEEYKNWLDEEYDPARFGKEEIALINAVLEEMYG